jgi:hypothetical protein
MASGHVTAQTGRTIGYYRSRRDMEILLAHPEPSTHGPSRPIAPPPRECRVLTRLRHRALRAGIDRPTR